jgi:hypothetical protein
MSITMIAPTGNVVHAEHWRRWQLVYAESSRKAATRLRIIVFTVALIALAIAFGVQLLSP